MSSAQAWWHFDGPDGLHDVMMGFMMGSFWPSCLMISYVKDILIYLAIWFMLCVAMIEWSSFIQSFLPYLLPSWVGPEGLWFPYCYPVINGYANKKKQ
jgi:hypothetical protein